MEVLIWQVGIFVAIVLTSAVFGWRGLAWSVAIASIWTVAMIFTNWLMVLQFLIIAFAGKIGVGICGATDEAAREERDPQFRHEQERERLADATRAEARRQAEEAQREEEEAQRLRQETYRLEQEAIRKREAERDFKRVLVLVLCGGISLFVGLSVFGATRSITLGIIFGIALFALPIVGVQAGKRMSNRYSVAIGAAACWVAFSALVLQPQSGAAHFWIALLIGIAAFAAFFQPKVVMVIVLVLVVPLSIGWGVFKITQSATLGIIYAVTLFVVPISWMGSWRSIAASYTVAVVASALFLVVTNYYLGAAWGGALFRTGLMVMAASFALVLVITKVAARIRRVRLNKPEG